MKTIRTNGPLAMLTTHNTQLPSTSSALENSVAQSLIRRRRRRDRRMIQDRSAKWKQNECRLRAQDPPVVTQTRIAGASGQCRRRVYLGYSCDKQPISASWSLNENERGHVRFGRVPLPAAANTAISGNLSSVPFFQRF